MTDDLIDKRYRLERRIGDGGMADVWEAFDAQTKDRVALKILKSEHVKDGTIVGRFLREARVAANIHNPHVVKVHGAGVWEAKGVPYMALELLKGQDLGAVLAEEGRLPVADAVDYVLEALVGVAAAHVMGIAHRDLKPSNLFFTGGRIKVLDFGIAKIMKGREVGRGPQTSTNTLVGSPVYMAPEQLRTSKNLDGRVDIWAIGVILYELLAGHPPFEGASLGLLVTAIFDAVPTPMAKYRNDVPAGLLAVIHRCLERDIEKRYATVEELAVALSPYGSAGTKTVEDIEALFAEETRLERWDPSSADGLDDTDEAPSASVQKRTVRMKEAPIQRTMLMSNAPTRVIRKSGNGPKRPDTFVILAVLAGLVFVVGLISFLATR